MIKINNVTELILVCNSRKNAYSNTKIRVEMLQIHPHPLEKKPGQKKSYSYTLNTLLQERKPKFLLHIQGNIWYYIVERIYEEQESIPTPGRYAQAGGRRAYFSMPGCSSNGRCITFSSRRTSPKSPCSAASIALWHR